MTWKIQLPVSGKHWMNSSGNSLVQAVRRQNRIRKRKKLWQQSSKATNGQHAKRKRHVKTNMEIFRSIRKSSPCWKKISIVLIVIPRWSMWRKCLSVKNYGSPRQRWNESTIIRRNGSARNAEKMVTGHLLNPRYLQHWFHTARLPHPWSHMLQWKRSAWQCLTIVRNFWWTSWDLPCHGKPWRTGSFIRQKTISIWSMIGCMKNF